MPSNPTAAILIIGNEILSGRTQDVNTKFIAGRLAVLGHRLEEVRVVPDIAERIVRAVNELRAAYDNLFTTGGIGPTHDDITSECIAAAFGVPWEKHQESWDALERHLGREQFNEARQRMAMLPRGAVPIPNSVSIAPGFSIGNVHVMAGVPRIMQAMFTGLETVLTRGTPIAMRAVHGLGVKEGSIAARLSAIQARYPQIDVGSYPFYREAGSGVAVVVKGTDVEALDAAAGEAESLIAAEGITPVRGEPPV
ncbi:MAG TPA: molybdopterin-binding protein [Acidiphilium sp.]|jgi:molybdenum cofactor synthesis domain-containing protein|uniref:competence/damage-inducible protein A n=1 Tax=unclassified Acidiphilium TaxID=2617493 RepID=UPI0025BB5C73|nr:MULTISPECIES: molybdopterin-binding protein [unclassified Acidiphilium]HQT62736.1 molybdopterin-binding protein [Acidiphilium sp.]HQU12333.1 molybdopterin-binding protein [Acidiphilium sp.]